MSQWTFATPLLLAMLERIEREFTYTGDTEPYWSVISRDEFLTRNIAQNEEEFLASGEGVVSDLTSTVARYQLSLDQDQVRLELGCGVGRSTIWLADRFAKVIAADISAPHLQLAARILRKLEKQNVETPSRKTISGYYGSFRSLTYSSRSTSHRP
jgi:tRNA/tmRNA/rRNA uracil-C5-methylase (TrmA/RlmC/RlmD family)